MLVKPDKIEYPSQSVIASPSSVEILNARSLETLQSPRSAPDLQKQFSMDRRLRVIGLLVCLVLLLGGVGGAAWLVVVQQQQPLAPVADSSKPTAAYSSTPTIPTTATVGYSPTPTIPTAFTSVAD